jgi:hypothetical protein
VENTDTHEKRLKVLYSWLSKHQRRIIGYSDDFYSGVTKILDGYLFNPDNLYHFSTMQELYNDVWSKYSFIRQAHRVRILEDLVLHARKTQSLSWLDMLQQMNDNLQAMKFELLPYFNELVERVIVLSDKVLHNGYLNKRYVQNKDEDSSDYGIRIKRQFGRLVGLVDELKNIRKQHMDLG